MNMLLVYSDLDHFIITCIVATTAVMFLLSWMRNKVKSQKYKSDNLPDDEVIENDLSNYALSFENTTFNSKAIILKSKIVLFALASTIVIMPFYEFIETLKPVGMIYGFSCLPY